MKKYRITVEFESKEEITEGELFQLAGNMSVQCESLQDGTIAEKPVVLSSVNFKEVKEVTNT